MENIEENVVTKGSAAAQSTATGGVPVEDPGDLPQKTISLMTIQQN